MGNVFYWKNAIVLRRIHARNAPINQFCGKGYAFSLRIARSSIRALA